MHRPFTVVLATACLLAAGSAARADQMSTTDYSWGYKFQQGPDPVHAYLRPGSNTYTVIVVPGTGSNPNMLSAPGSPTTISTNLWTASDAKASNPQIVKNMDFSVRIKVTDNSSGQSGWVVFNGWLNGDVWNNGTTLSPTFTGSLIKSVDINHHVYTVQFAGFNTPGGNDTHGSFNFTVTVAHNPEPSSLVLAGIGVPLLGLTLRRRRRQKI